MKREEGAGHRHDRLEQLVLEELRALLRDDVTDPRLFLIRLNAARLSVDYRHARVHFAIASGEQPSPAAVRAAEIALARAAPFLRARLAEAIEIKRVPDLRFIADPAPAAPDVEDEDGDGDRHGDEDEVSR